MFWIRSRTTLNDTTVPPEEVSIDQLKFYLVDEEPAVHSETTGSLVHK